LRQTRVPEREARSKANLIYTSGFHVKISIQIQWNYSPLPRNFIKVDRKRPGRGEEILTESHKKTVANGLGWINVVSSYYKIMPNALRFMFVHIRAGNSHSYTHYSSQRPGRLVSTNLVSDVRSHAAVSGRPSLSSNKSVLYCGTKSVLQHAATFCNSLQHTATNDATKSAPKSPSQKCCTPHCNPLQHTATYYATKSAPKSHATGSRHL